MRRFQMQWGAPGDEDLSVAVAAGVDEFDAALDRIRCVAIASGHTYQVDMAAIPQYCDDPLLLQFIIGNLNRGSLFWHLDGQGFAAVEVGVTLWNGDIPYVRFHGIDAMEPLYTQITPLTVHAALTAYVLTGERPETLQWREIEAD